MKNLANVLSCIRIIMATFLLLVRPVGMRYIIAYLICGMTDVADGFVARSTGTVSKIGSRLDSIADIIMFGVVFKILVTIIEFNELLVYWIVAIITLRLLSICIIYIKYRTFAIIHTYGNKLSGLLLFFLPIVLMYYNIIIFVYIVCIVSTLAAIEEVLINVKSKCLDLDRKFYIKITK